jgi:hypothetical protein
MMRAIEPLMTAATSTASQMYKICPKLMMSNAMAFLDYAGILRWAIPASQMFATAPAMVSIARPQ